MFSMNGFLKQKLLKLIQCHRNYNIYCNDFNFTFPLKLSQKKELNLGRFPL